MDTGEAERTYRTLALFKRDRAGFMSELRSKALKVPLTAPITDQTGTDAVDAATGSSQPDPATGSSQPDPATDSDSSQDNTVTTLPSKNRKYRVIGGRNPAMLWRSNFLKDGHEKTLVGKIDTDIFRIDR